VDRVLVVILLAGLGLRLVDIGAPLIDQQAWRQTDTAAIARNYLEEGLDRVSIGGVTPSATSR